MIWSALLCAESYHLQSVVGPIVHQTAFPKRTLCSLTTSSTHSTCSRGSKNRRSNRSCSTAPNTSPSAATQGILAGSPHAEVSDRPTEYAGGSRLRLEAILVDFE